MIQVRNKEHQSLGLSELEQLCNDNPNDSSLGLAIREMVKQARIEGYMSEDDWRKGSIWEKRKDG